MRVFYVYQKEGEMTDALEIQTQTIKKPHSGVCEKDTPVRYTTVG
jgi:hypothetical protein